jgi:rRNA-processing protein FCF1
MAARPNRPQLVAVDANVLFDLADGLDDVVDAVSVIRERLRDARFLIPPTVQHELANWAFRGDGQKREAARKAIQLGQSWRIIPVNLVAVRHGIAERIAERIREQGLITQPGWLPPSLPKRSYRGQDGAISPSIPPVSTPRHTANIN